MPISEKRPWVSNSLGCHPKDAKEHNDALRAMGVTNAGVGPDGRAFAHSEKGRNALLKAYQVIDKDGCYNQHTG